MEASMTKPRFNLRAFISIVMATAGLILPFSGLALHRRYIGPMTLTMHLWMSVHNGSAVLFMISAIIHIHLNRKAFLKSGHTLTGFLATREALYAIALVLVIVCLISLHTIAM